MRSASSSSGSTGPFPRRAGTGEPFTPGRASAPRLPVPTTSGQAPLWSRFPLVLMWLKDQRGTNMDQAAFALSSTPNSKTDNVGSPLALNDIRRVCDALDLSLSHFGSGRSLVSVCAWRPRPRVRPRVGVDGGAVLVVLVSSATMALG